jgi:capsular polysaccharide biosynthesis protein
MTRASDAARNTDSAGNEADRKSSRPTGSRPNGSDAGAKPSGASGASSAKPTGASGASGAKPTGGSVAKPGGALSPGAGSAGSSLPGSGSSGPGSAGSAVSGPGKVPAQSRTNGPADRAPTPTPAPPSSPSAPSVPARPRPPLPGPPPGMRMPGPPMPTSPRFAPPPPPRRRLDAAQRGKLITLGLVLVLAGAALGYLVALAVPTRYGAVTTIDYNIGGENTGDFLRTDRNLTTQTVLLKSRNVLGPVAAANGVNVDDLTKNADATILNQSNIIQLEVKDDTPDGAVNLANAIAKQYITVANASSPKGYIQSQLTAVQKQLATPAVGTTPANTTALQARQAALQSQLDQMNLTSNQPTVLVPAYALSSPVSPNPGGSALTGAICGLVIALMTAITLSRRWTRS